MDSHSLIIIRAWGSDMKYLQSLVEGKETIYLQSGFMKLPLLPEQFHQGAYRTNEIILKPEFFPQTGIRYILHADSAIDGESGPHSWVIKQHDIHSAAPVISGKPRLFRSAHGEVICQVSVSGKGPFFASIILQDTRFLGLHKRYHKFLLPLDHGRALLSGGGRGSAYAILPSRNYLMSISVMDMDGQLSAEKSVQFNVLKP
ncbi:MAG TPA: hypothetical protein VNE41_11655 [Chitinophagaceae bacterium]|nr:hypothetical protein [Chitinophagaceae bacterium]